MTITGESRVAGGPIERRTANQVAIWLKSLGSRGIWTTLRRLCAIEDGEEHSQGCPNACPYAMSKTVTPIPTR